MMSNANEILRDLVDTISHLCREHRPALRSVTVHPDDYAALMNHMAIKATVADEAGWLIAPTVRGVPIYKSAVVPKGEPWYDPPEAGPRVSRSTHPTDLKEKP